MEHAATLGRRGFLSWVMGATALSATPPTPASPRTVGMNLQGQPLSTSDYELLARHWIDPITADDANLRRIGHKDAVNALHLPKQALTTQTHKYCRVRRDFQGIWIPYIRPQETPVAGYRLRRDRPDYSVSCGGILKKEWQYMVPQGQGDLVYWPPRVKTEWLNDPDIPLIVTTGELKTLALWRLANHKMLPDSKPRFVPIGLGGVWNWRCTVEKTINARSVRVKCPIPDLDQINWKGRKVCVAFDARFRFQPYDKVLFARRTLCKELRSRSALIGLLEWDTGPWPCQGIDDLLAYSLPALVLKMLDRVEYQARAL